MIKPILSTAKTILGSIYALLFAALLGFLGWGSYQLYQNAVMNRRFMEEGKRVTVRVTAVDRNKRVWYDEITNAAYVSFQHDGRRGEVRFKQDTAWIQPGDQLEVWYHPVLGEFRRPDKSAAFNNYPNRSGLIEFTIIRGWTNERKWLVLCLLFTGIFATVALVAVANLIRLPLLKTAAQLLIFSMLGIALIYLLYNTAQYYRYYSSVKAQATEMTVTVLDTDRHAETKKTQWFYRYQARVSYPKGEKTIPINEAQYEQLKPNDRLRVLYNASLDDMMPVGYSPDHVNLVGCLFLVVIIAISGYQSMRKRRNTAV